MRPQDVRSVAVIGTGSVGASWAALFLARGMEVIAHDPGEGTAARARALIVGAWPALRTLHLAEEVEPPLHRLRFVASAAMAAEAADVVQENVPEKPALKAAVLAEISAAAAPHKAILSSTGGMAPSLLQSWCRHPERVVVLHPFNPSHLVPLVEVVGGEHTAPAVVQWAMDFARHIGKRPIQLKRETPGHMTNRLQFALMREAVHCLLEGVASANDIDTAVRCGLAPRWALMGGLLTLHLAGGPGGMQGILDHAGDAIEEWWTPLGPTHLDANARGRLVAAAAEVACGAGVEQWVNWRDQNLVQVLQLQRDIEQGAPG
jgi:carnitine 3-dehydrogenase